MNEEATKKLERLLNITALACGLSQSSLVNGKKKREKFLYDLTLASALFESCALKLGFGRKQVTEFLGLTSTNGNRHQHYRKMYGVGYWEYLSKKIMQYYERKIVYLAGKVSNCSYKEVEIKFQLAEQELIKRNFIAINPTKIVPEWSSWEMAMRMLIPYLSYCDIICLLPDWDESEGAKLEYEIARKIGLEILFYKELQNGEHN